MNAIFTISYESMKASMTFSPLMRRLILLLTVPPLLSACIFVGQPPEVVGAMAGLRDMFLKGFRGYWASGMLPSAHAADGRFYLDYDKRQASGSGTASMPEGGAVTWRIDRLEVRDPARSGRETFTRFMVLHGQFSISGGPNAGTYRRALIHITHFDSSPPWMALHIIRDDLDLHGIAQAARYAKHPGTLYFHAVGSQ